MKHKPIIPTTHPPDDREHWFSTFDVVKKFQWKRGLIKGWIEGKYITGAAFTEDGRGRLVFFTGFQLYIVRLFKDLLEIGFRRRQAAIWVKRIENEFLSGFLDANRVISLAFVVSVGGIIKEVIEITDPNQPMMKLINSTDHIVIVNFKHIVEEVDAAT